MKRKGSDGDCCQFAMVVVKHKMRGNNEKNISGMNDFGEMVNE